ncbi:hypothetical protein [Nostoc sp. FACHB-133]|uniref:hypothetical protein n=1 Tax=Nostoc sp. FACHB-133 TaxID=2692835 RepID=UPI001684670B|nr:hypothetical protein [Nostoc sp. FACHB-133]MBD2525517.1 hypothetical protein [Nostoc sp. FACHB-133]
MTNCTIAIASVSRSCDMPKALSLQGSKSVISIKYQTYWYIATQLSQQRKYTRQIITTIVSSTYNSVKERSRR